MKGDAAIFDPCFTVSIKTVTPPADGLVAVGTNVDITFQATLTNGFCASSKRTNASQTVTRNEVRGQNFTMKPFTPPEVTKLWVGERIWSCRSHPCRGAGPIPGQRLLTEPQTKRANLAGRAFELDVAPGTQVSQMITVLVQGPECIAVVTSAIKWNSVQGAG